MKILPALLIMFTAFSACAKKAEMYATNNDTVTHSQPVTDSVTYLALGDSYTIGEAEPLPESYPYQLKAALTANGYPCATPYIIATTGWTTDDLIAAIAGSPIHEKLYSFVTLLIGVNDEYQGLSEDNYRIKFAQVLNTAISFAGGDSTRVFVLSIPDWGVTPFAEGQDSVIGPKIDQFNAINKAISLKAGVNYLDITPISREAATDPTLVAGDGLHPSVKMYAMWIKLLEPMVQARLNKN